jgi:hypothetical protein
MQRAAHVCDNVVISIRDSSAGPTVITREECVDRTAVCIGPRRSNSLPRTPLIKPSSSLRRQAELALFCKCQQNCQQTAVKKLARVVKEFA